MLSDVTIRDGYDNFFTPLRLIFALLVLAGHVFMVALRDVAAEPFLFFEYKASYLAVNLFFIASGFMVTKSILSRGDMIEFGTARILRIYPALTVHVLFVMFVMGPFVTNMPLGEFFAHKDFWTQPFKVLSFYQTDMILPGALTTNDEQIGSAALWTLRYELLAYMGTAAAFAFGLLRRKWMLIAQFIAFSGVWVIAHMTGAFDSLPASVQSILRFGMAYGLGAAIFAYRRNISLNILGIPILGLIAALFHGTPAFEVVVNMWLAYIIFWAAYVKIPRLRRLQGMSDLSYGIYIYHWCILQWLFYKMPFLSVAQLFTLTVIATLIVALLSWNLIEKPLLSRKKPLAKYLRFGRPPNETYRPESMLLD